MKNVFSEKKNLEVRCTTVNELAINSLCYVTMRYKNSCYDMQKQWDAKTEIGCYLKIALLDHRFFLSRYYFYGGIHL